MTIDTRTNEKQDLLFSISLETGLYILAGLAALFMRLVILGQHGFSVFEAGYAYQAFQVSQGEDLQMLSNPAYIQLTAGLFTMLGSGEVLARILPALIGSAVILFPYVLREKLGNKAALVAAFGLALDPISVAISRQAGSPAMALGFLALGLFLWQKKRHFAAGFLFGLLAMSGVSFIFGLVAGLAALGLMAYIFQHKIVFSLEKEHRDQALIGLGFALVLVGTLLMLSPQGLAATLQAVPDYLVGLLPNETTGSGIVQVFLALLIYQPMAVIFALLLWIIYRNEQDELKAPLGLAFLAGLVLTLLYPGRQVWMLIWAIVPLWMLAGMVIGRYLALPEASDRLVVWGETVFYLILLAYWWLNLSKMTTQAGFVVPEGMGMIELLRMDSIAQLYTIRMAVTIFIPLLIVFISVFISRGWPGQASMQGAVLGVGVFLIFYLVMAGWGFSRPPNLLASEMWVQEPSVGYTDELAAAITETSVQITGTQNELVIHYQGQSPQVYWLLRDFPNASFSPVVADDLPDAVLTEDLGFLESTSGQYYAGQQIALNFEKQWNGAPVPADFDRWFVYRESLVAKEWIFLWTRADLFPLYEPAPVE
jgi:hypothetical protein